MVMGTSGPRTSLIRGGFNEDQYSTVEVRPPSISHSGSEHSSSTFFSSLPAQSISSPTSSIASSLNGSTELATLMRQELARLLGPELEALRQEREATERARRAADEAREAAEKRQKELAAQIYTALVGATDGYPSASPNE